MTESVHTARWISQLNDTGWDIHIFPSIPNFYNINPELANVTVHGLFVKPKYSGQRLKFNKAFPWPFKKGYALLNRAIGCLYKLPMHKGKNQFDFSSYLLGKTINKIKPDLIHILEMQHSGYLIDNAIKNVDRKYLPKLIYTPWGSDINLFGRIDDHIERIKRFLGHCDFYWPMSKRDIVLGEKYGFKGKMLPIISSQQGFETKILRQYWQYELSSQRKTIMLKGYQGWAGRSLFALKAIEACFEYLKGYEIIVYSASDDVRIRAEILAKEKGLNINILSQISHLDMIKLYGQSRFSIGASISDGVPNSLLESMVMGCLPIESVGGCANEFIKDGYNGFIIDAENVGNIANAIKRALIDDDLVNNAAEINYQIIKDKFEYSDIKAKVVKIYHELLYN